MSGSRAELSPQDAGYDEARAVHNDPIDRGLALIIGATPRITLSLRSPWHEKRG